MRIRQWPRHDENDLTSYIPKLAKALRQILYTTDELAGLFVDNHDNEQVNKCMTELAEGMENLKLQVSECLGALACTYHRLHGRASPVWEEVEKMWPLCADQEWQGVFQVVSKRIMYNDFIESTLLKELENVCHEVASAEVALHYLVWDGVRTKEQYEKSGSTLSDPNHQYDWDADDEGEKST